VLFSLGMGRLVGIWALELVLFLRHMNPRGDPFLHEVTWDFFY
jgi:hypothetical protein